MGDIDVLSIFFNFLWIGGLAVLLATWSYAYYAARISKIKVRDKFETLPYALALDAGMLFFITGMLAIEDRWWAQGLWGILGIVISVDGIMRMRAEKQSAQDGASQEDDSQGAEDA